MSTTVQSFGQVSRHKQVPITPENMPQGPVLYKGITFRNFLDLMNIVPIESGLIWYKNTPDLITNQEAILSGQLSKEKYENEMIPYYQSQLNPYEVVTDPITNELVTGVVPLDEVTVLGYNKKGLPIVGGSEITADLKTATSKLPQYAPMSPVVSPADLPQFKLLDENWLPVAWVATEAPPINDGADAMIRQDARHIELAHKSKEDNESMLKPLKYIPILGGIVSGIDLLRGEGDWTDALNVGLNIAPFAPGAWGNLASSMGMTSAQLGEKAGKMLLLPMITGMASETAQQALTGTTISLLAADLLKSWGWNPTAAEFAGSMAEPGYWVNPFGKGKWTEGFFNGVGGMNKAERAAARRFTKTKEAIESNATKQLNQRTPLNWLQRKIIDLATKHLIENAYKELSRLSPILFELNKRFRTPYLQNNLIGRKNFNSMFDNEEYIIHSYNDRFNLPANYSDALERAYNFNKNHIKPRIENAFNIKFSDEEWDDFVNQTINMTILGKNKFITNYGNYLGIHNTETDKLYYLKPINKYVTIGGDDVIRADSNLLSTMVHEGFPSGHSGFDLYELFLFLNFKKNAKEYKMGDMLLPSISDDNSRRINEIRSTVNEYILHVSNRYNLKDYDKFVLWVDENKDLAFDYFFNGYKIFSYYQKEMIEQYKKQPIEIKKEIKEWFLNKLKTHFATIGAIGAGATLINNANKLNNE